MQVSIHPFSQYSWWTYCVAQGPHCATWLPVVLNTCALSHFHRGCYSWMWRPNLVSTSCWMRLGSTCRNECEESVTSLAREPSLRFLVNGWGWGNITLCGHGFCPCCPSVLQHLPSHQQHHPGPAQPIYMIIWDNVCFHRTKQIREFFTTNSNQFLPVCLPPNPFPEPDRGVMWPDAAQRQDAAQRSWCMWCQ